MGIVARTHHEGIDFRQRNRAVLQHARWIRTTAERLATDTKTSTKRVKRV